MKLLGKIKQLLFSEKQQTQTISLDDLIGRVSPTAGEADLEAMLTDPNTSFLSNLDDDGIVEVIDEMLQDDQVFTELETLKAHVTGQQWEIKPPAEFSEDSVSLEIVDSMRTNLTRRGNRLYHQAAGLLDSLAYGSAFAEVVWKDPAENFGMWEIDSIVMLERDRYGFNGNGDIVFADDESVLEEPYKYISMSHDVTKGNPFGNSALLKAYWPWKFRKECIKSGILYAKKSIIPSLIAIYQASQDTAENEARAATIAGYLRSLQNSAGAALANVDSVEKIEANAKGDDIIGLVEMFNRMISKAILGVATLTNDTRYSNRGDTFSQEELINARAEKIGCVEFAPVINKLLQWTHELNNPSYDRQKEPYFFFSNAYDPTFEEMITLINSGVVQFSRNWFFDKFSIVESEGEEDNVKADTPKLFSAKSEKSVSNDADRVNYSGQIDFFRPSGRRVTGLERLTEIMTTFSGNTQSGLSKIFGKN